MMRVKLNLRRLSLRVIGVYLFFILNVNAYTQYQEVNSFAELRIRMDDINESDTFCISVYKYFLTNKFPDTTLFAQKCEDGYSYFNVYIGSRPLYISLFKERLKGRSVPKYILELYLIEPGDNIVIDISKDTLSRIKRFSKWRYNNYPGYRISFSGNGCAKYKCKYEIDNEIVSDISSTIHVIDSNSNLLPDNHSEVSLKAAKGILCKYKDKVTPSAFKILKTDFFSSIEMERMALLLTYHSSMFKDQLLASRVFESYQSRIDSHISELDEFGKRNSIYYPSFAIMYAFNMESIKSGKINRKENLMNVYLRLKSEYFGEVRDRILTSFLFDMSNYSVKHGILDDALSFIKTEYCLKSIRNLNEHSLVGKLAYNFSLPDTSGLIRKLNDFKGKVVFVDFWYIGCTGCASYYTKVISKVEKEFVNDTSIIFVSINVDTDKTKWMQAVRQGIYTSQGMVNLNTNGKGIDHIVIKKYNVVSYPKPILIGRDGRILCISFSDLRGGGAAKLIEILYQYSNVKY